MDSTDIEYPDIEYPEIEYTEIDYAVTDRVATITLHRPERMNAFTSVMCEELLDAFDRADADPDVRVVLVTGQGRAFCAGADLAGAGSTFEYSGETAHRDNGGRVSLRIFECTKPVIGAINGAAVGIGATMTLPMDVRLAASSAKMGFVFSRRGIVPEACSSWFLPRVVGISRAVEWVTTGRVFDAEEAHAAGLVRSVHEPDELLDAAYSLAAEIAENTSAVSVALARQMMWRMLGADHPMEAHRVDSRAMLDVGGSADAQEGIQSFLDKRDAEFPGRVPGDLPSFYPWWQAREFTPLD
jgi:enoyl-CoA hydratase/carnithine racemase